MLLRTTRIRMTALVLLSTSACLQPPRADTASSSSGSSGSSGSTSGTGSREACFDARDDDGDGLADCADPDCRTEAECRAAEPGGFQAGTAVAEAESCPPGFGGPVTLLHRGINDHHGEACVGCACTPRVDCATTFYDYGENACPGGAFASSFDVEGSSDPTLDTCSTGLPAHPAGSMHVTSGKIHVGVMVATSYCLAAGTPTRPPVEWAESVRFCAAGAAAGGCAAGDACVPRTARNCLLQAGDAACPAGYSRERATTWFTGVDDSARACPGTCSCDRPTEGTCGDSKLRLGVQNDTCSDPASEVGPGGDDCLLDVSGYRSAEVKVSGEVLPTCAVASTVSGDAVPTGEMTLCCL